MHNEIAELINSKLPEAKATVTNPEVGDNSIVVEAESIKAVCKLLKKNKEYSFNSLQVISGVDYTDHIEVNYFLNNLDLKAPRQLQLKTKLEDRINPTLDSVTSIWKAADWQERECFDMLGVTFKGHPDPRRILCPDDWTGFPLRRDYMAPKVYNGMEVFPESKMNTADREFKVRQKMIEKAAKAAASEAEGEE